MAKTLIIAGCICIVFSGYLFKERYNPVRLSIATYKKTDIKQQITKPQILTVQKTPASLQIRSLKIHLPLIPAKITNQGWETTTQGVSYLTSSPMPGNVGNSILYGHNWPSLLGNLRNIKPGDTMTVYYSDGTVTEFEVEKTAIISPNQIGILDATEDTRITIYTCTGFLDSQRFIAVALKKNT